jgi:hypothetical protein
MYTTTEDRVIALGRVDVVWRRRGVKKSGGKSLMCDDEEEGGCDNGLGEQAAAATASCSRQKWYRRVECEIVIGTHRLSLWRSGTISARHMSL